MSIFIWILGFLLFLIGLYLVLFPEKFLSYDSRRLPNFWDPRGFDLVLINWKSRKLVTFIIGIIFLVAGLLVFWSIYYYTLIQARIV